MFMIATELIAATQGIGYLLSDGRETSRPDIVILAIILLAILTEVKISSSVASLAPKRHSSLYFIIPPKIVLPFFTGLP